MSTSSDKIVLYGGPTSPFARMARIYGNALDISFAYEEIDVYTAAFLDPINPLRQIPTVLINGETALFDSRTIFAYFETLSAAIPKIFDPHFQQETRISLALGLTDACLSYRMESMLPDGEGSDAKIEKLKTRMNRCLVHLETSADEIVSGDLRLEQIVVACALDYIDFRYVQDWQKTSPKLVQWRAKFTQHQVLYRASHAAKLVASLLRATRFVTKSLSMRYFAWMSARRHQ